MNQVFETAPFSEFYLTLEKNEQEFIENVKDKLVENLNIGKPLKFYWLREKRYENKRLYYIINIKTNHALLIAFGNKKEQQKLIDHIINNKETYLSFIN